MRKKKIIVAIIVLFITSLIMINGTYLFVFPSSKRIDDNFQMGIIDGSLSLKHNNILNDVEIKSEEKTHGDLVLSFLEAYNYNIKFMYYDAIKDGKISTDSIIEGLNWMLDNKVNYVCISLSSNYYSEELEDWINNHKCDIIIYASYSNLSNTIDYPAQYRNVIGVGSDSGIVYKENDVVYKESKIILINYGINTYSGNSYLAPLQMVKDAEKRSEDGEN